MSRRRQELTDEFDLEAEDGRVFHVLEYTTILESPCLGTVKAPPVKGLKDLITSEGYHCNCVDADPEVFEIVELHCLRVRRVSR